MKTYGGSGGIDGPEWLASRPGSLTSGEKASGTHWRGRLVDPKADLDTVG
jgi:hypothetical protein